MPGEGAGEQPGILATCVESLQPVSTGLYASYGIVPRMPMFALVGEPRPGSLPALPPSVRIRSFESIAEGEIDGHRRLVEAVGSIDHARLGYARAGDHRAWRVDDGRQGFIYVARGSGEPLGYGYVQTSGRVGPVALLDPALGPAVVGDLMQRARPAGAWLALVPGVADHTLLALLRAGLRFDGTPALFCSTRDGPRFEGYLPASFALL